MSPLTLQEVIERINKTHSEKEQRAKDNRIQDPPPYPEFIPRITRLFAHIGARAKAASAGSL